MALKNCLEPGCDGQYHKSAMTCPQCGAATRRQMNTDRRLACRSCGEMLVPRNHVRRWHGTSVCNGNTVSKSGLYYDVAPCPKCGNQKPLKYFSLCYGPTLSFFASLGAIISGLSLLFNTENENEYYFGLLLILLGIPLIIVFLRCFYRKVKYLP